MRKILKNQIQCRHCGDIIESKYRHDYCPCSCGCCAVDGGHDYLRRSFRYAMDDFIELSEWEDVPDDAARVQF